MVELYIIAIATLCALFVLFLVLIRTLNGIIGQLTKLEYMLQKEYQYKKEEKEIKRILEEQADKEQNAQR